MPPKRNVVLKIVKPNYSLGYMRMLVYGISGVGKTTLVASAADVPDLCPILFCDVDKGTMSISNREFDTVAIESVRDMKDVADYIKYNPDSYKTVILDGLTAYYYLVIAERLTESDRSTNEDPDVPSLRDYQFATFRIRSILTRLKESPINFLATAQVDIKEDEVTGRNWVVPALSTKLATTVGGEFDLFGYLSTRIKRTRSREEVTRTLQLAPFSSRAAKNRSVQQLPSIVADPTVEKLYRTAVLGEPYPEESLTLTEESE